MFLTQNGKMSDDVVESASIQFHDRKDVTLELNGHLLSKDAITFERGTDGWYMYIYLKGKRVNDLPIRIPDGD